MILVIHMGQDSEIEPLERGAQPNPRITRWPDFFAQKKKGRLHKTQSALLLIGIKMKEKEKGDFDGRQPEGGVFPCGRHLPVDDYFMSKMWTGFFIAVINS